MDFSRETWRKLYVTESADHRLWPVAARGVRDLLLRLARDDGTLLSRTDHPCQDMARALGSIADELGVIASFIQLMIDDGYLTHSRRRLFITRFEEGQERAKSTSRVRRHRKKQTSKSAESFDSETFLKHVTKRTNETDPIRSDPIPPIAPQGGQPPAPDQPQDQAPPQPPNQPQQPKRQRKVSMPKDWAPNETAAGKARDYGLDLSQEADSFREWTGAKGAKYINWDAAFLSHLRRRWEQTGGAQRERDRKLLECRPTTPEPKPQPALPPWRPPVRKQRQRPAQGQDEELTPMRDLLRVVVS